MSIDNDDADDDIFLLTDSSSSGGQCTCINYIVHVSNQNSKWPIQRISKSQKMDHWTIKFASFYISKWDCHLSMAQIISFLGG